MSNKKNATVGFRLAFNYMKANRYVDAIDVGKDILKAYPDYPKVQKEIIEKARQMLRAWRNKKWEAGISNICADLLFNL